MEITLKSLEAKWKRLSLKKTLSGDDALEAVKQDGDALRYVKEQIFDSITERPSHNQGTGSHQEPSI